MKVRLSKIINEAAKRRSNKDKVETLRRNDSPQLRELLAYAINPNITFKLPEGDDVPYTPDSSGINLEEKLYSSLRKMENLIGLGPNADAVKKMRLTQRERIFIDMLEEVHPEDAKLLIKVKNKDIGIKSEIIKEAFPEHFKF